MELNQPQQEDLVRQAAYALWEKEGRPQGQADRHWLLALDLVATTPTKPAKKKRGAAKARLAA